MMLYITTSGEGFGDNVISDIGFDRSQHNLPDALTKPTCQVKPRKTVATGHLDI